MPKSVRTVGLVTALVTTLAFTNTVPLNAAATHSEKGFYCTTSSAIGGSLSIHWPTLTSSGFYDEPVYFMAVIYRWNPMTGTFQPFVNVPINPVVNPSNYSTWYYGIAGPGGPKVLNIVNGSYFYWRLGSSGPLATTPTVPLPKGYYKVREYFHWQYGTNGNTWATLLPRPMAAPVWPGSVPGSVKAGYCQI